MKQTLREQLQQAIEWLDPSTTCDLELANIQLAYDTLLPWTHQDLPVCGPYKSWQQRLHSQLVTEPSQFADWLDDQSDLYRSIILASFLALQLMIREEHCFSILQQSIEHSLLVLKILYNANNDTQLAERLLESRYPLLNALFLEPLLPLSRDDRAQLWENTLEPIAIDNNLVPDNEITNPLLSLPNHKELLQEEIKLIKMANTTIPNNFVIPETFIYEPTHTGKVSCVDCLEGLTKHRLRAYSQYGFLTLSKKHSSQPLLFVLKPSTTLTHAVSEGMFEIHIDNLTFQVEHLQSGLQWITSIQEAIVATQVAFDLQQELINCMDGL
jgi:hypothetical protein